MEDKLTGSFASDAVSTQLESLPQWNFSFGEKLVGLTFNPSNDDKVGKAKRLCADLADLLNDDFLSRESSNFSETLFKNAIGEILFKNAIGEILNAQMNVVKVLTLKY